MGESGTFQKQPKRFELYILKYITLHSQLHIMAMPASTANWHWKSKSVTPWAKSWFESELPTIILTTSDNVTIGISSVTDVEGDVELGMRKSKLITIFDVRLALKWSGEASLSSIVWIQFGQFAFANV
jgi:hypothetical protein